MNIKDHNEIYKVFDDADLDQALTRRYSELNDFWITHENQEMPALMILVKNDLANIHYFPEEGHPGFISLGDVKSLEKGGSTTFLTYTNEKTNIGNECVVPFSAALEVAKEFLRSSEIPKSARWFEL